MRTEQLKAGDVCVYEFDDENESLAVVEIKKIINEAHAEVRFLAAIKDDTGNGMFDYLLYTGQAMQASLKYLRKIVPQKGENPLTDVLIRKKARWLSDRDTLKCSDCGFGYYPESYFFIDGSCVKACDKSFRFAFCPNCGADMRERHRNEI